MQHEVQRRQKREQDMLEENEKNLRISQLQHSIAWLSNDEKIQETQCERTSNRRHAGTCEWMANEPQFKNWIQDDTKRSCLWLDGKPGSGSVSWHPRILSLLIPPSQARVSCARISFKDSHRYRV